MSAKLKWRNIMKKNMKNANNEGLNVPGACNQKGVIYQATVTIDWGGQESYIGLDLNFKKRFFGKWKTT